MENYEITKTGSGLRIEGFPDAVKVISLKGHPKARRLSDFALHLSDLEFALQCLEGINDVAKHLPEERVPVLQRGLWHSAIVHFLKCFGGNDSRPHSLHADVIYRGKENAFEAFEYFKHLRNKHLVHDENSYSQCDTGAIINWEDSSYKITKVVSVATTAKTLEQANFGNLHSSISCAREWVLDKMDSLCSELTSELEVESYDDVIRRDAMTYTAPTIEGIGKPRRTK